MLYSSDNSDTTPVPDPQQYFRGMQSLSSGCAAKVAVCEASTDHVIQGMLGARASNVFRDQLSPQVAMRVLLVDYITAP